MNSSFGNDFIAAIAAFPTGNDHPLQVRSSASRPPVFANPVLHCRSLRVSSVEQVDESIERVWAAGRVR